MKNTFAYIAGYIDGDGCFYLGKTTNKKTGQIKYQSMLIIASTNSAILKFFASLYGGSVFCANKTSKIIGHKPQYQFVIKHENAFKLLQDIAPFLTEKKKQADIFCKFVKTISKEKKDILINSIKDIKHNHDLIEKYHKDDLLKRNISTKIPKQIDYAYLAGFIDAECCLSIQHYKPKTKKSDVFKIYLSCTNSKLPIFRWLLERFAGNISFIPMSKGRRNMFIWRLSAKALSFHLPKIHQHLRYKKPVCEKLIEFYNLTLKNGGDRQSIAFKQTYASLLESKFDIIRKVHFLNLKGTRLHSSG